MTCPICGKENAATAKFCRGCGAPNVQPATPVPVSVAARVMAPVDATIALPASAPPMRPAFAPPAMPPPDSTIALPGFGPPRRPQFPSAPAAPIPTLPRPSASHRNRAIALIVLFGALGAGVLLFWMRGAGGGGDVALEDEALLFVQHIGAGKKNHFSIVNSDAKVVFTFSEREWMFDENFYGNLFKGVLGLMSLKTDRAEGDGGILDISTLERIFFHSYLNLTSAKQEKIGIDQFGTVTKSPKYQQVGRFSNGLAPARPVIGSDGLCGYIDRGQNPKIPPAFQTCDEFHEGLAVVSKPGPRESSFFIDTSGKAVIKGEWDNVYPFRGERALIIRNKKIGFLDKAGREAIPPQFDNASAFSDGLAPVHQGALWGYVDLSGKLVIPHEFDSFERHVAGRAIVKKGDQWQVIDKAGKAVNRIPLSYAGRAGRNQFLVRTMEGRWGLIDASGSMAIPAKWAKGYSAFGFFLFANGDVKDGKLQIYGPGVNLQGTGEELSAKYPNPEGLLKTIRIPIGHKLFLRVSELNQKADRIAVYLESAAGSRTPDFLISGGK